MKEASLETILITFALVAALLANIWSLTFDVDVSNTDFYRDMKYINIPVCFILIGLLLIAVGSRNAGFGFIILVYGCSLAGTLTRLSMGFNNSVTDQRLFITSNSLEVFGILFGTIIAVTQVFELVGEGSFKKGTVTM